MANLLKNQISRGITLTAAGMMLCVSEVRSDSPAIAVEVNGRTLQFQGGLPTLFNNEVFVPLRVVFDALGAYVNYDPSSKTITASNAKDNVVLQVDSPVSHENGQSRILDAPARVVDGATLVPLRFVAQALGAQVSWNEATSTVQISTLQQHLAKAPPTVYPYRTPLSVNGVLTQVDFEGSSPFITVRSGGTDTLLKLTPKTQVVAGQHISFFQVPLTYLRPGEGVWVTFDEMLNAISIVASSASQPPSVLGNSQPPSVPAAGERADPTDTFKQP
jgi:hypothetical protein